MILQSIRLHNFMSYEDAHLDLNSINVACLSGANGAGKSALLDAATWAIWEKGRAGSDELIRLGQKEMWVDLIFLHEGNTYRIRRSRQKMPSRSGTKSSTSKGTVDLQMLIPGEPDVRSANNGHESPNGNHSDVDILQPNSSNSLKNWKSLTASSIAETQDKILQLLRMDYQTFINSAYLRQGAADQFARETAMKRKEILGEILGLSYFDLLQDRCKEHLKPLKLKSEQLNSELSRLPEIETKIGELQKEQESFQNNINDCKLEKDKRESNLLALQRKEHELKSWQEKQISLKTQITNLGNEITHLTEQKEQLTGRLINLKTLISDQSVLESDFADYETTTALLKGLEEKSVTAQTLERQKLELRSKLSESRTELELELKQVEKEAADLAERKIKLTNDTENQETIISEYQHYQELIHTEANLANQQEQYTQLKQRIAELQTIIDEAQIRLSTEIEHKTHQLDQLKSLLNSQDSLDKQKVDLSTQESELDKKEQEFQFITEKGQDIKTRIERIGQQIIDWDRRQQEHLNKIEELNKTGDSTTCPLCAGQILDKAAVLSRYQDLIKQAKSETATLELEKDNLDKERNVLRAKYNELKTELSQRKVLDTQKGQLSEKLRSINEAQENQNKLAAEIETLKSQYEKNDFATVQRASLINLTAELNELKFDPAVYASIQAQIRGQRNIEARYHQLQRDLSEIKKIKGNLPTLLDNAESLKVILQEESYGTPIRDSIRNLDSQYQQLSYDNTQHNELKQKLTALMPKIDKYKDLKNALAETPLLQNNLERTETWLTNKNQEYLELNEQYNSLSKSAEELPDMDNQLALLKSLLSESQNQYEALLHEQAKISANLELSKKELDDLKDRNKELTETLAAADDLAYLAECFGKKGIQAIVIENAVPEIESDANRILSRLTDNKMHVGLITQSKNKSGNINETLDIVINDDIGTRNYELYSGGEAFKVNFAIRVALSRLLARRAGAKLETLIIDEGFGSQDDYSRDKLVKAIRSIQPDFARILVITHFADVKDMFPTHIQINKHSGISQIELIN